MRKHSVAKNYIFNLIYQVFILIVPLITTPYISRVLGANGVGQYSFSNTLCSYFTAVASLGFITYGQRMVATQQEDIGAQSRTFFEIVLCRFPIVVLMTVVNIILCLCGVYQTYTTIMYVMSFNILAIGFDITFFFQGNEEFSKIVIRNVIVRIISIALIFLLVKKQEHVWIYALIQCGMVLVGNASLWGYLRKRICRVSIKELHPFKHLWGTFKLFIPTIATQIYVMLDKTLIGTLIPDTYTVVENGIEVVKRYADLENGYYESAEKIVKMAMTIVTCMGPIYLSRNSSELAQGNIEKCKENVYNGISFTWMLSVPMTLGVICIASNFVPWFFGDGYEKCVGLMMLFSPLIIIIGFSNLCCYHVIAPLKKDMYFVAGSIGAAVINLILNLILIPKLWSYGALIATVVSEFAVTVFYIICIRKFISIPKLLLLSVKYLIAGVAMFAITYYVASLLSSSILNTIIIIVVGIASYSLMVLLLRDKYALSLIKKVKDFFVRRKK